MCYLIFSLVFDVGQELGIHKSVFALVSVHAHHGADGAACDDDQKNRNPDKGLHCHQI